MSLLIILIAIFTLGMLAIKRKWKPSFALLFIALLGVGIGYYIFYGKPLAEKKERVSEYFSYFQKQFHFQDHLESYAWEPDHSSTPRLTFEFKAYQKDWVLVNDTVSETTPEDIGIGVLRNHIYTHYAVYVTEDFLYNKELGNDFSKVISYLKKHGYDYQWNSEIHYPKNDVGFDLYIDDTASSNLRIDRSEQEVSLEEERNYYKGKTMKNFDFLDYIEFFDYDIYLTGTYYGNSSQTIDETELNQLIKESLTHNRLTVILTKEE